MKTENSILALPVILAAVLVLQSAAAQTNYFRIQVLDDATGRGVPLVELTTTHQVRLYTDNAGLAAFFEPGLMGQRVFFFVRSHGYEFPKDGFGNAGAALDVKPGGRATLKLKRLNVAERLYRLTGAGGYRDSVLLGERVPVRAPLWNAQVLGQDSVQAVPWRGRIYWFWGDTARASYPLGNFHTTGATSQLPARGGLDPAVGVDLTYFTNRDGFVKPMVPLSGEGMVWLDGLLTVPDETGATQLVAHYSRMKSLGERLEHGLVRFDAAKEEFVPLARFDNADHWRCPRNQSTPVRDGGADYVYFLWPDRAVRVWADLAHVKNAAAYEAFTCLADGSAATNVVRDARGQVVWFWRTNAAPLSATAERKLIAAGQLTEAEARFQLHDVDTGQLVTLHTGTVNWNAYRRKWITIGVQSGGTSILGEVWYAEADSPTGPWRRARKIVTHDRYSFYNPAHHAFFDQDGGRLIYFEGTYANTFSGNPDPTPRYDYNQILYRLDMADPRLKAAQAPAP